LPIIADKSHVINIKFLWIAIAVLFTLSKLVVIIYDDADMDAKVKKVLSHIV